MPGPSAIAEEQAALRRVATLVAAGPEPAEIFHAVAEEAGRLLGARSSATIRYDGDVAVTVGRWQAGEEPTGFHVGTRVPLTGSDGLTAVVARTGRSARIDDYTGVRGRAAAMMRENGYRAPVPPPVVVGGTMWGPLLVPSAGPGALGADAERRLGGFAELVALGLESAEAREQLNASRRRILQAAFDERRRLERNLHDGAQQRLVSLALQLRVLEGLLARDPRAARRLVAGARAELHPPVRERRGLARGLHPGGAERPWTCGGARVARRLGRAADPRVRRPGGAARRRRRGGRLLRRRREHHERGEACGRVADRGAAHARAGHAAHRDRGRRPRGRRPRRRHGAARPGRPRRGARRPLRRPRPHGRGDRRVGGAAAVRGRARPVIAPRGRRRTDEFRRARGHSVRDLDERMLPHELRGRERTVAALRGARLGRAAGPSARRD